jgi:hypothetical protein
VDRIARLILIGLVALGIALSGASLAAGHSNSTKPGKGCGDKNHTHYKESDCKHH